jgi:hypothetical protein
MDKKKFISQNFEVKKVFSKIKKKINYKSNIEINNILQEKIENVYNREWSKLEKGFQKNRLNMYINTEVEKKKLNPSQHAHLKNMIYVSYKKKLLTNNTINYNIEKGLIEEINILNFCDKQKLYTMTATTQKKKPPKNIFSKPSKPSNLINKYLKKNNDYKEKLNQDKMTTKLYIDNLKN